MKKPKILILFFSKTGLNRKIAQYVQKKLDCDIEEIKSVINYQGNLGYFVGGTFSSFKICTKARSLFNVPQNYDLVVLVSPLWVGLLPPPVRTVVSQYKFNQICLISISGNGGVQKSITDLEHLTGLKSIKNFTIPQSDLKKTGYLKKLNQYIDLIKKINPVCLLPQKHNFRSSQLIDALVNFLALGIINYFSTLLPFVDLKKLPTVMFYLNISLVVHIVARLVQSFYYHRLLKNFTNFLIHLTSLISLYSLITIFPFYFSTLVTILFKTILGIGIASNLFFLFSCLLKFVL